MDRLSRQIFVEKDKGWSGVETNLQIFAWYKSKSMPKKIPKIDEKVEMLAKISLIGNQEATWGRR